MAKKETGRLRKLWVIFKNGKAEIWFILNIWNTVQLWMIRKQNLTYLTLLLFGLVCLAMVWGYIDIKKIKTSSPYLNPFQQDTIKSSVLLYEGFIEMNKGNNEKASEYFIEARELRIKWVD